MLASITPSFISNIVLEERPYEIRDTRLKGLLLRVQPSGCLTFYLEYERGKRVKIGRADALTPSQAREQSKIILADHYQGKDPVAARNERKLHTFLSFIDEEYRSWAETNIRTHVSTIRRLKGNLSVFLNKKLPDIKPLMVEKWRAERLRKGAKRSTINRDLDDLKSSLAKAEQWGFIQKNPISGVKRWKIDDRASVRYLNEDELNRLKEALGKRDCRMKETRERGNQWRRERSYALLPEIKNFKFADHLNPMVLLSLHTGIRQGELFSLTWGDVYLDMKHLTVHGYKAKSQKTRHVPLNGTAQGLLSDWREQIDHDPSDNELVFPGKDGRRLDNVRKAWQKLLSDAGIKNFRWHDMRHTFASRLVMAGVDLNTVRELLGHSDYQMTLRYAHLAPEHKASAVSVLD